MPGVVTGISQNGDIAALEKALRDAGFSLDPIQVIGPDDSEEPLTEVESAQRIDTELMIGGGQGTGVPGISGGHLEFGSPHSPAPVFRNESLWDRLGDFEIPDNEIDNYLEALAAGRTVIAYFAHHTIDKVPKVEELFRANGLAKVKTF